jgi:beta-lactam-binding protein with PASTA domain
MSRHYIFDPDALEDSVDLRLSSSRLGLIIFIALIASMSTVGGLHLLAARGFFKSSVICPVLVGLLESQARSKTEEIGLALVVTGTMPDPVVARGAIAQQSPLAGTQTRAGSPIQVILSQGPSRFTLPSLQGLTERQAKAQLDRLGLKPGESRALPKESLAQGLVITTEPAPGSEVSPGLRVVLVISGAPPSTRPTSAGDSIAPASNRVVPSPRVQRGFSVSVPKVVGLRLKVATRQLRVVGLKVGRRIYRRDEDHSSTVVLHQAPASGKEVPRGSKIDLVINRVR